jgi:hypothetical protein
MVSLMQSKSSRFWHNALTLTLLITFVGLVGADLRCKYRSLSSADHGQTQQSQSSGQQSRFSDCLCAHHGVSTAMPSDGATLLLGLEVVGASLAFDPVIHLATSPMSLTARAPPAV